MRIVGEIPNAQCKITIFYWNNKYLIKLERGLIEQTYKVPELEVSGEEDVKKIVNEDFLAQVVGLFDKMEETLYAAIESL